MIALEQLENFMRLLHAAQNVERVARIPNETKWRSTAEHTFELAMFCWYVSSANNLELDQEKILKYALAHDIVEAYAGDTPVYDTEGRKSKEVREEASLQKIRETFVEFPELVETIETYDARQDPESAFVYAADKLIDPLNYSMDTRSSIWKEKNISYERIREYKDSKIAVSKDIEPYWHALCKKIEANKDFFFNE